MLTQQTFQHVFDKATYRVAHRHFLMLARSNDSKQARLGLVIGKKNIRLAVDRNRVKRIARETFRRHQSNLPALDIIVIARRGLGDLDKNIATILSDAWLKLGEDTGEVQAHGR